MTDYGYVPGDSTAGVPQKWMVELTSGETMEVLTEAEQRWFTVTRDAYRAETGITEATDKQDLDRLLCLELMVFRWNQWAMADRDYEGQAVDPDQLRRNLKDQSVAITQLKASLGMDKKSRDASKNEGDFFTWFQDAARRAKIMGIHRENQLRVALVLMNELSAIVGGYDRSDEEERKKLGYETEADIVKWVREHMIPKFHEVDEYFLTHEQRFWKRDL